MFGVAESMGADNKFVSVLIVATLELSVANSAMTKSATFALRQAKSFFLFSFSKAQSPKVIRRLMEKMEKNSPARM